MTTIARLFPRDVATSQTETPGKIGDLLPAERCLISNAAPRRIAEFAAGRRCARQAIARLGLEPASLPVNVDRTVRWPREIVGSIAHIDGYCAVAVASSRCYAGIGLDVERILAVPPEIVPYICAEGEQDWLDGVAGADRAELATLIFVAKECFYKCQYSVTRTWLDFKDIRIRIGAGDFLVTSKHPIVESLQRKWSLRGKFMRYGGRMVTGMVLER